MRHLIIFFLIIAATTLMYPPSASACFCQPPDLTRSIRNASFIFSGKVVEISPAKVVFEIEVVWKGVARDRLTLHRYQSSCELVFENGRTYLVYALKSKDWLSGASRLSTNQCSRTRRIAEAEVDVARLLRLLPNTQRFESSHNP